MLGSVFKAQSFREFGFHSYKPGSEQLGSSLQLDLGSAW